VDYIVNDWVGLKRAALQATAPAEVAPAEAEAVPA
jgi:hypothetical protein